MWDLQINRRITCHRRVSDTVIEILTRTSYTLYIFIQPRDLNRSWGLTSKLSTDSVRENRLILPRLATISPKFFTVLKTHFKASVYYVRVELGSGMLCKRDISAGHLSNF
ncbi:uncharacterized protein K441DRAFT_654300 [Cenococcum geophilum 1.58]|uniref:uncharacterized protein n=1 Tax=Cenococcum geophilum 1.58 TaxID=794803 RepID=UPI00358FA5B2|nr:hypothetical protein K441DRAFT_654300 [Cenococcum geophilum 1.58]